MAQKCRRIFLVFLCLMTMALPLSAGATTFGYDRVYHYPAITFVVLGASPEVDMRVTMIAYSGEDFRTIPEKETRLWENYFRIYRAGVEGKKGWYGNQKDFKDALVHIEDQGRQLDIPIPYEQLQEGLAPEYFFINMKTGSMSLGVPSSRLWLLFFVHLAIYLLVESLVFWHVGIRDKRSWRFFLIWTCVTKGAVCFAIRGWLNVDVRLYIVFAALTLFLVLVDIATFLFVLEEDRNKIGKFAGIANLLAGFLVYQSILRLPM